jgi:hypothetical protein
MASIFIGSYLLTQKIALLESGLVSAASKANELEAWAAGRVKYVYPNGGSAGNESTVTVASTYVIANPFALGEERVTVIAQANNGSGWFDCGNFIYWAGWGGVGVKASLKDGLIFLAVGSHLRGKDSVSSGVAEVVGASSKIRIMCVLEGID